MKTEVIEKLSALMTAAFGLVAALAWNSAIQKIFVQIFGEQSSIAAMIFYAIIVTVIAVVATMWIGRLSERAKTLELKKLKNIKNIPLRRKKQQELEAKSS